MVFTSNNDNDDNEQSTASVASIERKKQIIQLMQDAAAKLMETEDPWSRTNLLHVPAERIVRHLYDPVTQGWRTDETICKMESDPFTHGAMRYCYRMKKRAQPPPANSSSNNVVTNCRFHRSGWKNALNYVAKAYITADGKVDCSYVAKQNVRNDIRLQYEAQHWATAFNNCDPPTKIHFLRAYAIEFPDRVGKPMYAVERYITGTDLYGAGFTKHNTNAGYVDPTLRRVTPQVFSAFSFHASHGRRLVADIQGVSDLYTDPQILSDDYRYGDGDLGPRGMALFFVHFRNCQTSDALGIPTFPLSPIELHHQAKYDDDEITETESAVAVADSTTTSANDVDVDAIDDGIEEIDLSNWNIENNTANEEIDLSGWNTSNDEQNQSAVPVVVDAFQRLDLNRKKRSAMLRNVIDKSIPLEVQATQRRSNCTPKAQHVEGEDTQENKNNNDNQQRTVTTELSTRSLMKQQALHRSKSQAIEVQKCLDLALTDYKFTHTDFHRYESGELRQRKYKTSAGETEPDAEVVATLSSTENATPPHLPSDPPHFHRSARVRSVSAPMEPSNATRRNLGKVHYQLAVLHGSGRFPSIVSEDTFALCKNSKIKFDDDTDNSNTPHDIFSVLFHLAHAASLQNVPACLSLARALAGLDTCVSNLLPLLVAVDLDCSKDFLQRAIMSGPEQQTDSTSYFSAVPIQPRVAAGCLLVQLLRDECSIQPGSDDDNDDSPNKSSIDMIQALEDTAQLLKDLQQEETEISAHRSAMTNRSSVNGLHKLLVGDKVEANYAMEGTYYSAVIVSISDENNTARVQYDDDSSTEELSTDHIRIAIPPTATQTGLGGPLSDDEALGTSSSDDKQLLTLHEVLYDLAMLKEKVLRKDIDDIEHQLLKTKEIEELYIAAADDALAAGKMKLASEWSLKAASLQH